MSLMQQKVILLDTQTTGTSAARDRLLEIGWACTSAEDPFPPALHSLLLLQPEPLPKRVSEITGVQAADLEMAHDEKTTWEKLREAFAACPEANTAVAHYAQFERPFLDKFFTEQSELKFPLPLLCTYKIAKRLFPEAPSRNIRGLAGYLGCEISQLRRATDHVLATSIIWRRIASELQALGVHNFAALEKWMLEKPAAKKSLTQFRVDRLKRLQLPKGPGIYRMLSKTGEILYVGKATSLNSRVNSYFRGGCTGDNRKLEMIARVFEIEVEEAESPLEAALLENEEIKLHKPHYNRALKPSPRALAFFSRDFSSVSVGQDAIHSCAPVRNNSALFQIFDFIRGLSNDELVDIFYGTVTEEIMEEGFQLFLTEENLQENQIPGVRALLAWGMKNLRLLSAQKETDDESEVKEEEEKEEIPEPVQVANGFRGLCTRAAQEYRRAKQLGRILNSTVHWEAESGKWRTLRVKDGRINVSGSSEGNSAFPWNGRNTEDYDRMSVLLTELSRFPHRIENVR